MQASSKIGMIICAATLIIAAAALSFTVNFAQLLCNDTAVSAGSDAGAAMPLVLVDAGHGGVDGGAVSPIDGTVEKGLNLDVAEKTCDFFRLMGFRVQMTRESDTSIHDESADSIRRKKVSDIRNRLKMLDEGECEFLVSIHMNIFVQQKYNGTQVFYGGNNAQSQALAESVQSNVKALIQPNNERVVKKSTKSIYLLYNAKKPAIMVECGFLSNAAELQKLKSADYQQQLAAVIAKGAADFRFSDI